VIPVAVVLALIIFDVVLRGIMRQPQPAAAYPADRLDEMAAPYMALYDELATAATVNLLVESAARLPVGPGSEPSTGCGRAGEHYLSAPVAPACERDDRAGGPDGNSMRNWPVGSRQDPPVHRWARVAVRQKAGWRAQAAVSAARAAREAARQADIVARVRARCAEPIPYLAREWQDTTGSFGAFVENGAA
jgi:hypothetical protein